MMHEKQLVYEPQHSAVLVAVIQLRDTLDHSDRPFFHLEMTFSIAWRARVRIIRTGSAVNGGSFKDSAPSPVPGV